MDGWLLYEFHGVNPIAKTMLGLGKTTRRAFVLVPARGEPTALIHAIEGSSWRHWPFAVRTYSGWRQLEGELTALLEGGSRLAAEVSPGGAVPTLDYVPAGAAGVILSKGVELISSGDLVSRFHSVLSEEQLLRHREAAKTVASVAERAFERAADAIRARTPTCEGELSSWIVDQLTSGGLVVGPSCIVAIGPRAADPHYVPVGDGESIGRGDLLLIDLWGSQPGGAYADQTWMGYMGAEPDARTQLVWETVRNARDEAVRLLRERAHENRETRGSELDDAARAVIADAGFGEYFVHRLGHSMDVDLHGSGPNLDNLETRDERVLLPGVAFSVEPGIYIPHEIGVRSEINVFMGPDGPEVTPARPQTEIFRLLTGD